MDQRTRAESTTIATYVIKSENTSMSSEFSEKIDELVEKISFGMTYPKT